MATSTVPKYPDDPVTLHPMQQPVILLPCEHSMCAFTLREVWKSQPSYPDMKIRCPLCRNSVVSFIGRFGPGAERLREYRENSDQGCGREALLQTARDNEFCDDVHELWEMYKDAGDWNPMGGSAVVEDDFPFSVDEDEVENKDNELDVPISGLTAVLMSQYFRGFQSRSDRLCNKLRSLGGNGGGGSDPDFLQGIQIMKEDLRSFQSSLDVFKEIVREEDYGLVIIKLQEFQNFLSSVQSHFYKLRNQVRYLPMSNRRKKDALRACTLFDKHFSKVQSFLNKFNQVMDYPADHSSDIHLRPRDMSWFMYKLGVEFLQMQ